MPTDPLLAPGANGPARASSPHLQDPLQYVKGVGPRLAPLLAKLGLSTIEDLLWYVPRRWEDRSQFRPVREVREGEWATVRGRVVGASSAHPRPGLNVTRVLLDCDGGAVTLVWFNQAYRERAFQQLATEQKSVVAHGKARRAGWMLELGTPEWELLQPDADPLSFNRIVPVYALTEGLQQARLRKLVELALRVYLPTMADPMPESIRQQFRLVGAADAFRQIHFPDSFASKESARRRLAFEELFNLQVLVALRKRAVQMGPGVEAPRLLPPDLRADLEAVLPFELTGAQRRAIDDIARDVESGHPMNRLLQGDVGSGKTAVAVAAMLMAVRSGWQAALMAPTEILAQQHAIVLKRLLEPAGVQVDLATGSLTAREKQLARKRIECGAAQVAVGTHALIQGDVAFDRLALIVIDEQHRFGVLQRQALAQKGRRPHILVMTATPIPRTLTLTLYGDLDVSILNEMPPGRRPVVTHVKRLRDRPQVYSAAEKLLRRGRQVYIVCPLVGESEKLEAANATELRDRIAAEVYPTFRVDLLHGQMKAEDKEAAMARFKAGEVDVLVSTTVIEVGIDVPNACVMIIEDADRFGLAQLHQLRGRVGRGEHASYCVLVADPHSEDAVHRLRVMRESTDGFCIAEEDLKLRGPGEFFGTRQSGMPQLMVANLMEDAGILAEAREAAVRLVQADPDLSMPGNVALKSSLSRLRGGLELATVS